MSNLLVLAMFDLLNNSVKAKNGKVGSQSLNEPVDFSNETFFPLVQSAAFTWGHFCVWWHFGLESAVQYA